MTRHYGRAPRGERARGQVPHGHGKVLTVWGALTAEGVLAAMTAAAATDADVFGAFLDEVLGPALRPGQVVVMDNLPAHKAVGVRRRIEACGCRLLYLPPYSPDRNPIEMAWSKLKAWLRAQELRAVDALAAGIGRGRATITAQDARGFFRHCGYALH
jgi:transposase